MGEVYRLPIADLLCSDCVYGYLGANGTYCVEFSQFVDDDAAKECEQYEG